MVTLKELLNLRVMVAAVVLATVAGCGSTGGGSDSDDDFVDGEFVDGGSSTGTIDLELVSDDVNVAETVGFFVTAKNSAGGPVGLMKITCDSEDGVAIIEPSTGSEFTDANGRISGRIGCNRPGSLQFVCRGPIGLNRQDTVTVKCAGEIPAGFAGFDGAGGTLGNGSGGVGGGDDGTGGGSDPQNTVLIESISVFDGGDTSSLALDVLCSADCDGESTTDDPEACYINDFSVSMKNNGSSAVTVTSVAVFVPSARGAGTSGVSLPSQRVNVVIPANGGSANVTGLLTDVNEGDPSKNFAGTSTGISAIGVRNVSFTLSGETEDGRTFELTSSRQVSFTSISNCAG